MKRRLAVSRGDGGGGRGVGAGVWRRPFRQTFVGFLLLRKVSFGAFLITLPLDACVLFAGRSTPPGMDRGPDPPPEETSVSPGAGGRDRPFGDSAARACPGRPEPDNSIGVGLRQWEFLRSIACAGASSASSGVRAGGASPGGVGWGARLRPEGASRKARAAPPPLRRPTHTRLRRRLSRSTGFRGGRREFPLYPAARRRRCSRSRSKRDRPAEGVWSLPGCCVLEEKIRQVLFVRAL